MGAGVALVLGAAQEQVPQIPHETSLFERLSQYELCTLFLPAHLQTGCLTPSDVQSIAQGQLISFINALINTGTSDAIRGALGG